MGSTTNPSAVGEAWAEPMRRAMEEPHDPSSVELQLYAVVDSIFRVDRLEAPRPLVPLQSLHWTAIEQRFHYKGQPGLHVLLLRAHRLPAPRRIPNTKKYDGCRSWVKLDGPIETTGATPVLAEIEFDRRAGETRNLPGEFEIGPKRVYNYGAALSRPVINLNRLFQVRKMGFTGRLRLYGTFRRRRTHILRNH